MTGAAFALVGLAVLAAGIGFVAWRGERAGRLGLEADLAALRDSIESERSALEQKTTDRRERAGEIAELRQRLEKAKRRAFSAQEERAPLEARAAATLAELRDRDAECKRLRDEVARLEGDTDAARRDVVRLREEASQAVQERDKAARVVRSIPTSIARCRIASTPPRTRCGGSTPRSATSSATRCAFASVSARTAVSIW